MQTLTYIIVTIHGEYYCGKTNNLKRRIEEHKNEREPHWFGFKNRKDFRIPETPKTFREIESLARQTFNKLGWAWIEN
ncbi:MAG: GIY-YIG nuclease family protein, partial [Candidatus Lokiarchaeota archaeon]|nr:GIY-YIG nuclease family protein [Candidatus Lokiarchaeota archaeon]